MRTLWMITLAASALSAGVARGEGAAEKPAQAPAPTVPAAIPKREWTNTQLAQIKERFGETQSTPTGLLYVVKKPGEGEKPPRGAYVTAHYHGTFLDGKVFDSSRARQTPFSFNLGLGRVIKGWDEAFADMRKGEERVIIVPWWLAYGELGRPPKIPPQSPLVFEVQMLDWKTFTKTPGT